MKKLVGIDWSQLSSPSYTHCFSLIGDDFVSNCSRDMVQPFVSEVLMSSFVRYPSWKITIPREHLPPRGREGDKLYIAWIFLFQSKILNFAMIGFYEISLSTFIKNSYSPSWRQIPPRDNNFSVWVSFKRNHQYLWNEWLNPVSEIVWNKIIYFFSFLRYYFYFKFSRQ